MAKGDTIKYLSGVKYVLSDDYSVQTKLRPPENILTEWVSLGANGMLYIVAGFGWDGASGPTFDTLNSMRGSLVHDALYSLLRMGELDQKWRQAADEELRDICIEDGMSEARADAWFVSVRMFASECAAVGSDGGKPICVAP